MQRAAVMAWNDFDQSRKFGSAAADRPRPERDDSTSPPHIETKQEIRIRISNALRHPARTALNDSALAASGM